MATLESGADEAPAQGLPKELAMVTSCLQGAAINPEPGVAGGREHMCGAGRGVAKWN